MKYNNKIIKTAINKIYKIQNNKFKINSLK